MMGGAVKLDPPMKMVHPEALSAGIRLARELDRLDHLFSDAPEYRELRARATAFLDAMNALLAADPTPDALRVLQQQPPSGGHHAVCGQRGNPGSGLASSTSSHRMSRPTLKQSRGLRGPFRTSMSP
jgi:hypothetical protein